MIVQDWDKWNDFGDGYENSWEVYKENNEERSHKVNV